MYSYAHYPRQGYYGNTGMPGNACAGQAAAAPRCPQSQAMNPCKPPVHSETVRIPHHVYTVHRQTHVARRLEHEVHTRQVPVTQEMRHNVLEGTDDCPPQ